MKHYSIYLACLSLILPAQRSAAASYQVKTVLPGMQSQGPIVPATLMPTALMPTALMPTSSVGIPVLTPTMNLEKKIQKIRIDETPAVSLWERLVAAGKALAASDPKLSASGRMDDALIELFDDSAPRSKKLPDFGNMPPVNEGRAPHKTSPLGPFGKVGKFKADVTPTVALNLSEAEKKELAQDENQITRRSWLIEEIVKERKLDDVFALIRDMSSKSSLILRDKTPGSGNIAISFQYSGEKKNKPALNDSARIEMNSLKTHKRVGFSVSLSAEGFSDTKIVRADFERGLLTVVLKNKGNVLSGYMKMVVALDPSYGIESMSISNGTFLMPEQFWNTLSAGFADTITGL